MQNNIQNKIREKLIKVARSRHPLISYEELNSKLELGLNFSLPPDRDLIGRWLGDISEDEVRVGRHMLSALVGHKKDDGVGDPGKGFYNLAHELGLYVGGNEIDNLDFWAKEVKWLHEYWTKH